jgi:hypothetical protein
LGHDEGRDVFWMMRDELETVLEFWDLEMSIKLGMGEVSDRDKLNFELAFNYFTYAGLTLSCQCV